MALTILGALNYFALIAVTAKSDHHNDPHSGGRKLFNPFFMLMVLIMEWFFY